MADSPAATQNCAAAAEIACALCGRVFQCRPGPECWCAKVPFQPMPDGAASCLCPDCLAARHAKAG